jgi:hypothetical protein
MVGRIAAKELFAPLNKGTLPNDFVSSITLFCFVILLFNIASIVSSIHRYAQKIESFSVKETGKPWHAGRPAHY